LGGFVARRSFSGIRPVIFVVLSLDFGEEGEEGKIAGVGWWKFGREAQAQGRRNVLA